MYICKTFHLFSGLYEKKIVSSVPYSAFAKAISWFFLLEMAFHFVSIRAFRSWSHRSGRYLNVNSALYSETVPQSLSFLHPTYQLYSFYPVLKTHLKHFLSGNPSSLSPQNRKKKKVTPSISPIVKLLPHWVALLCHFSSGVCPS